MKVSEKLSAILERETGLRVAKLERLYPGQWNRWMGAWSWCATMSDQSEIGSLFTMTDLVRAKNVNLHKGELYIEEN